MNIFCPDNNVVIKLLTKEEDSEIAANLWNSIIQTNTRIISPEYLKVELHSVLLQKLLNKKIDRKYVKESLEQFSSFEIEFVQDSILLESAFDLAFKSDSRSVYDFIYLALGIKEDAIFVTEDAKFAAKAKKIYKKVYNLKEAVKLFI